MRSVLSLVRWLALGTTFAAWLTRATIAAEKDGTPASKPFLVVAPDRFRDALKEFVADKQRTLPTELVSLETVLRTTPGSDDPERLKRYLYNQWRDRGLGYVLLVGDVDVMPVRCSTASPIRWPHPRNRAWGIIGRLRFVTTTKPSGWPA
jgi:hypothetical protein